MWAPDWECAWASLGIDWGIKVPERRGELWYPEAPKKTTRRQSQAQQTRLWTAQTCSSRDPPSKSSRALAKKDAMRLVGLLARAMTVHAWRCLRNVRALRIGKLLVVILSARVRTAWSQRGLDSDFERLGSQQGRA